MVERNIESIPSFIVDVRQNIGHAWDETVTEVKKEFSIKEQINRYPWYVLGGSFVSGVVLERVFNRTNTVHKVLKKTILQEPLVRTLLDDLKLAMIGWTVNKAFTYLKLDGGSKTVSPAEDIKQRNNHREYPAV